MKSLIETAQSYRDHGLSVIPINTDGSKKPKVKWAAFQKRHATDGELEAWFGTDESGIGIVCGAISGGLRVLDFDTQAEATFDKFLSELNACSPEIASHLVVVKTPRPGRQVWFRQAAPVPGNEKLAMAIIGHGPKPETLIETRGEGGYVVVPGGPVAVHSSQVPYEFIHGEPSSLQILSDEQVDVVLAVCRKLNQVPEKEPPPALTAESYTGPPRPGDVFNENANILELLMDAGWSVVDSTSDVVHLARPGKEDQGHSATVGHMRDAANRPLLYVFSSNAAPFEAERTYTPFDVYRLTQHGGDYSNAAAAARQLYADKLQAAQKLYYASSTAALPTAMSTAEVPYKPFPLDCLPETVRDYVLASAEAINIDAAFVAVPMLSALAALIGGSRSVALKKGWVEPSIIWTVTIAPVSSGKSPGWDAAIQPLKAIQNLLHAQKCASHQNYLQLSDAYATAKAAGEKDAKKPQPPQHTMQLIVSDATMEALAEIAKNNNKLILAVDELAAWRKQMNQYRDGRDTENWLSAHNGGEINVNRKKDREHIWVPRTNISVTGTTQPEVADSLLFSEEALKNGLAARLLSARPPAHVVRWSDNEVADDVRFKMNDLAERLYRLKGHTGDTGGPSPMELECSPEARELFKTWIEDTANYAESMPDGLRNSWCKLRPAAARLALILAVTSQAMKSPQGDCDAPVDAASMNAGILLAKWFGYEIERNSAVSRVRVLHEHLAWITTKHPRGVTVRHFQMGRKHRVFSASQARDTLAELAQQGHGSFSGDMFVPVSVSHGE